MNTNEEYAARLAKRSKVSAEDCEKVMRAARELVAADILVTGEGHVPGLATFRQVEFKGIMMKKAKVSIYAEVGLELKKTMTRLNKN